MRNLDIADPEFCRALVKRDTPASFAAIADGSRAHKERIESSEQNYDIMGVVSRLAGLGYIAHPSSAAMRTMLKRRLAAASPPADDITLADLEGLRTVVSSLYEYVATDSPTNVVFVASGAAPIGFALQQKYFSLGRKPPPSFHFVPGPRWDKLSHEGKPFDAAACFVDVLQKLLTSGGRTLIIDTSSTGESAFSKVIEMLTLACAVSVADDASIDFAVVVNRKRAVKEYDLLIECGDGEQFRIRQSTKYPIVPSRLREREWQAVDTADAITVPLRVCVYGVPYLFSEDAAALLGVNRVSYLEGGIHDSSLVRLWLRVSPEKRIYVDSSGGLDITLVNLLASDDDAVSWRALHGLYDDIEGSPIDVMVIVELSSHPDTLLVLNDFTRLPSGFFQGSLHEASLAVARRLVGGDLSLQVLSDSVSIRGISGLKIIRYDLRDCRLQFFEEVRTDQGFDGNMRVEMFGREADTD